MLKLKGGAFSVLLSLLMSHFPQIAFSSISNGLVRLLVLPPEPGTAPWLLIPTSISDAGICLCCIDCSVEGLAQRQRPVDCHLCVLAEQTQRLFNLLFLLACCFSGVCPPDCCLSSHSYCVVLLLQTLCCLPLFFHVGLMCVTYICMVLYSSLSKISAAFPFLLACCLIFCLAYLITLPVSNLVSCLWSRYPYMPWTT